MGTGCRDHPRSPIHHIIMDAYCKRWVFTGRVLDSEWGLKYHRVWFTYVYDLYTFSMLRSPSKNDDHVTVSKEGYLLDCLVSASDRLPRLSFKQCVRRYNLDPGFTQL